MKHITKTLSAFTLATLLLAACSKQHDVASPESPLLRDNSSRLSVIIPDGDSSDITGPGVVAGGKVYRNGNVYTVKNFKQAYSPGSGQPADGNFYWRFSENNAGTPSTYEIKMTGVATGDITSADSLKFINKSFAAVTAADWAAATNPGAHPSGAPNIIGMDQVTGPAPAPVAAYANSKGWYIYHWVGHTVEPVSGRTLLLKSGSTIVKFQITSIYQDGVTGGMFPYYNFIYETL
ncbi:hypothetical protein [Chitinophaga sp.]|uniref:hypothetical protein n=1 Tax=Chitinophaga sp. TaxID=1869181 RepID=UPI0031DC18CF